MVTTSIVSIALSLQNLIYLNTPRIKYPLENVLFTFVLFITFYLINQFYCMKNLLLTFVFIIAATVISIAQNTSKIKVAGNCGMCKKNIETAAKAAGAMTAAWDKTTKVLTVAYDASATSTDKIETAIANAGYDTEHQTASNEAYNKLDECCQYDRVAKKASKDMSCCKDKKCDSKSMDCCKKDATCAKDKSCCKKS